jgi:flagellar FliL protein
MVAAALALVLAAGGGGVWVLKKKAAHAAELAAGRRRGAAEATPVAAKHDAKAIPVYLPLDPFIVNLADKDVDRYAQIGITLELESAVFADQVKAYMPSVRNAILLILAQKSSKDLLGRSRQGRARRGNHARGGAADGHRDPRPRAVTTAASGAEKSGQDEAPPKPKKAKKGALRNPVQHVHFSSFIIQ